MWIGEQITERGIGKTRSSILIFVGIASSFLGGVNQLYLSFQNDQVSVGAVILLALVMVAVIAFIVFMEQGYRKVPIQYARRVVGRNVYGGQRKSFAFANQRCRRYSSHFAQIHCFFFLQLRFLCCQQLFLNC
jgi:preprotein translocase subunit SecY